MDAINAAGRGRELDVATFRALDGDDADLQRLAAEFGEKAWALLLPGTTTSDLPEASENLTIARRAVSALRGEANWRTR